jgi:hypothetical protein
VHTHRPGGEHGRHFVGQLIGFAGGQNYRRPGSQPARELDTDLAAAAEDQHRPSPRVIHGCDYYLR